MVNPEKELGRFRTLNDLNPDDERIKVFVSYAHIDDRLRRGLQPYLTVLEGSGLIATWWDVLLKPDDPVHSTITHELESSDIVIMLISIDFLASWYVKQYEMPIAFQRRSSGKCNILPVVLVPTNAVNDHPSLNMLNPQPRFGGNVKPISKYGRQSDGWNEVYAVLKKMVAEARARKKYRA